MKKILMDTRYLQKSILKQQEQIDQSSYSKDGIDELRDDFYAVTFISYIYIDDQKELIFEENSIEKFRGKRIGEGEVARNLMNCVFIFLMQMGLSLFAAYNFYQADQIFDPVEL